MIIKIKREILKLLTLKALLVLTCERASDSTLVMSNGHTAEERSS